MGAAVGCDDGRKSVEECAVIAILAATSDESISMGRCNGGSSKVDSSASRGVGPDADALMPDL